MSGKLSDNYSAFKDTGWASITKSDQLANSWRSGKRENPFILLWFWSKLRKSCEEDDDISNPLEHG